jgi:hypothetical protein
MGDRSPKDKMKKQKQQQEHQKQAQQQKMAKVLQMRRNDVPAKTDEQQGQQDLKKAG